MREHGHSHEGEESLRPPGDRIERDDEDLLPRAAAAGRTDVLGTAGMLGLQRTIGNAGVGAIVDEERSPVHDVVSSGQGRPLDAETRADMEARLGQDFGDVRVHTGDAADASAKAVNAQAYTAGSNVVFQHDRYDPSSDAGRHMLAHELTHVTQQRTGPVDGTEAGGGVRISDPGDRFEREAATSADRVVSNPATSVQRAEAPSEEEEPEETAQTYVQRQQDSEEEPEEPT